MTAEKKTKPEDGSGAGMHLVRVVPLARGVLKEELTYFTSKPVTVGSIVAVPIRRSSANALVVSVEEAYMSKSQLKASPYAVKKIDSIKAHTFFLPGFVSAAREAATHFATTTGAVLTALTPAAVNTYPKEVFQKGAPLTARPNSAHASAGTLKQTFLVQSEDKERVSTYKSVVREEFAKGASVFFCLPEISEIERIAGTLARGIEEYTYVLHGSMTKKEILTSWNKALKEEHPVLIIATGQFLSLPRPDITTIILDKESSRAYKQITRPFVDIRTFAEMYTRHTGARLIVGDIFLRPETIYKQREGQATELSPLKFRALSTADQAVIDMKQYTDSSGKKTFVLFSDELRALIKKHREESENTFILTARRGLHSTTVCNDCGNTVLCTRCSAPTVLHKGSTEKDNRAICHKCGLEQEASDRCNTCGGWRLATLGAGIEHIEEELKKEFPDLHIFRIDKDTVSTHKKAVEMREKFYNTPGSVLLGTEMAVAYLDREVDNAAIVSVDSLFTIPDFRINERVFNVLLRLRLRATRNFLIQTRDIENRIFDYATKGNMIDFYREEIAERKILVYPPFVTLIKITREGVRASVEKDMDKLAHELQEYKPVVFPAFITTIKGKYRLNMLLKIPAGEWVDEHLLNILRGLPPTFAIRVDPEDVL